MISILFKLLNFFLFHIQPSAIICSVLLYQCGQSLFFLATKILVGQLYYFLCSIKITVKIKNNTKCAQHFPE